MALTTFSGLKTSLAAYLNRSDLTSNLGDFVALAEARIAYGSMEAPFQSDPLRIRAMEISADLTVSAQSVALPTGFLAYRSLYLSTDPATELNMVSTQQITSRWSGSGKPHEYALEGDNIVFGPAPDSTYTAKQLYYKKFDALSADGDTNWLLTNSPGAYLWGALLEAWTYIRNTQEAENAHKKFVGIINTMHKSDKRDRYSGAGWQTRVDSPTP